MECDGNKSGSNIVFGGNKELGLGFDVKMDLGKKKRCCDVKIELDDDDEPIGSLFKVKSRKVKKVKVDIDEVKKVELVGMDDTLAAFRKKLKGPKKEVKGLDLDLGVKSEEMIGCEDKVVVESVEKVSKMKSSGKEERKRSNGESVKKDVKVSGSDVKSEDLVESVEKVSKLKRSGKEEWKISNGKTVKKKKMKKFDEILDGQRSGEGGLDDNLEDSLSAFLLKKSRKGSKLKQVKTVEASIDKVDQNVNEDKVSVLLPETPASYPGMSQRLELDEELADPASKGRTVDDGVGVDVHNSSSAVAKLASDFSEIEVQEKKMDPSSPIRVSLYERLDGLLTSPIPATDEKMNEGLQSVGEVVLEQVQDGSHGTQPSSPSAIQLPQKEVISSVCGDHETVSVSSQKENVSASTGRLSPVSLAECNKSADEETPSIATDQNEAYGSDTGSLPDPETKDNKKSSEKRIVRQPKRYRQDDMAYEGDADWDVLNHERNLFVSHEDGDKVQSVTTKGKLDFLQSIAMDTESGGAAAVSVGLKARAAGPVEKIKFKEILKRKGGIQEYIDCRNHILHLWNKDVTRILPLSECGISDTADVDEHPQASLVRDIYSFLDQYGYINFGVVSNKEISDGGVKPNFRLLGKENDGGKSGAPVTDLDDGVSFILGKKNYEAAADENDIKTELSDPIVTKDKGADMPSSPCESLEKNCHSGTLPNSLSYTQVEDSVDQKDPTLCIQCDDSEARKKIIVIGAGPAGLTAARHLQRQGFHVTVLEGRDRIGGRVFTDRSSLSVPVDLGASIITGVEADVTSQRRPDPSSLICAQLGLELTVLNSDCPLYDTVTGQKVPPELDEALEAEYNSLLDEMQLVVAKKGDHAMKMSLEEGLEYGLKLRRAGRPARSSVEHEVRNEEILSPLERRVMDWHLAHLEYGCAASLQEVSLPYWNQDDIYGGFGGAHCMIKGGYGAIVDSLKDGLHIHMNHKVTDVCYESKKKVKVSTENGRYFTGDAVLVTVPLGCLKAKTIKFSPSLPEWKYSSIQRLGFGVLNKVVLEFPEVFWDDSVDYFGATADESDQRGWCFMFWNVKKTVNAPVLIALVVGKAAISGQDLTPSDHVKHALVVLRKLFGEGVVRDPVASVVTDWGRDPFSYGAYSYVAVGASGEDYDTLGRPVNNCLFFAGEATCKEHPDTVGGAMMTGMREAVRIVDILTTGNDFTAEVEAIAAAKRHSDSERSEVRDIIRRLDTIELTHVHKNSLLRNLFKNAKSRAGRLHLAKELLDLPSDFLKSFAGTKEGLGILNSWILDSMGKNGTQLLRQCVRLLVRVSTDLLAVRLSGIGKTVKEKVCVHTSRDIRAIASQLVSVWVEIFRKEKASNGGLKLLRQSSAADASRSKSNLASRKPPLRAHHTESRTMKGGGTYLYSKAITKSENKPSSSQGSAGKQNCKEDDYKDLPLSKEEQDAIDAAEAAHAAARAAAEAYESSGARCSAPLQLPKIPSFHKFARREQYAQMDDSELQKKWTGGVTRRQDCISEIDSRNCRVRDWSVDFSAAGVNLESSKMAVDNHSQRSHSNENAGLLNYREHSGESAGVDSSIFTKAWVDSAGSEGLKDHSAIDRWQSQAAAADSDFFNRLHIMKKTATKVMEQTTDAEKAMAVFEFLDFKRKNKIRAFVDRLIERHMAMKTDTKSGDCLYASKDSQKETRDARDMLCISIGVEYQEAILGCQKVTLEEKH
nr:lysine-specific histone demethylase 1 homolog 3 [Tanacetum cinerariifolium]